MNGAVTSVNTAMADGLHFRRRLKFRMMALTRGEFIPKRTLANVRSWADSVSNYVLSRQNPDGGYTFWRGADSNAQDTYYGLAVLKLLDLPLPSVEETLEWLRVFELGNVYSYYYVGKALLLCGEDLDERFHKMWPRQLPQRDISVLWMSMLNLLQSSRSPRWCWSSRG